MEKSKRLFYECPQLEVVALRVTTALLAGSGGNTLTSPSDYEQEDGNESGFDFD